ncbi:response regulator transcription factor [Aquicoccus sp. G2-2]|uniref:response regulator transcription factor n=1 Tax=Aquicoccus sp. G2-2 TaxID=3092120 RepID=UPI002AE06B3D|nr:response regulator transcription factor [Aquicoccus sp. G2-2]MEA1114861.1 response regulator transcription factor [Aquicoccus sp. G2-2]
MKILVAEDDAKVGAFVQSGLTEEGYTVDWVQDGRDALSYCLYNDPDLAIVDRMMPGMDGLSLVKALRAANNSMPVIFLTALGDVDERVEGLTAGGDDYMVKPFHLSELLARVKALSRRPQQTAQQTELNVHDLSLNLLNRTATRQGQVIALHAKEFALLEVLMHNAGRVVTRSMLLERIWGFNFDPGTSVLETHVSRLRAKIDKPFDTPLIHTMRNMGYSLHAPR